MMKRIITIIISTAICLCVLSACAKSSDIVGDKQLKPTESIKAEDLIPADDFLGTFSNDEYVMTVEKSKNKGELHVSIKSAVKDKTAYEWDINAFFSESTYRINYTDAVKTVVKYSKDGKETERVTEYTDGVGRIQFSDSNTAVWENSVDKIENSKFTKQS